jgi:hypothetical protein
MTFLSKPMHLTFHESLTFVKNEAVTWFDPLAAEVLEDLRPTVGLQDRNASYVAGK